MRDQFKAVHHVPTIGNEASGPAYSVPRLVSSLNDAGYASELFTTEPAPSLPVPNTTVFANGWGSSVCCHSRDLKHAILNACIAGKASVLHTHGMWDYSTTYLAHASRTSGIPLVFSPRGTLLPPALARHKFRKRALWRLLANPILEQATAVHATSDEEAHHLREYSKGRPVVVIPNGIDLPSLADTPKDIASGDRTVLFLGRVHPIKNVDRLITAWSNLESRFPQWRLRIVGTAEASYGSFLKNLAAELQVQRVDFPGPAFGSDKLREYGNADLYVLPSSTENFGMTVAEALAAAVAEKRQEATLRLQPGYDHSYFFVSSFMEDHVTFHAEALYRD